MHTGGPTSTASPVTGPAIRAQYHFRLSPEGLLAWDVRRLIALAHSQGLQPQRIPLSEIAELDENYWYDTTLDADAQPTPRALAAHMRLALQADDSYPILLCAQGRLMDGMHRVLQRLVHGHHDVLALRFATTPPPDYVGVAPDALPYQD